MATKEYKVWISLLQNFGNNDFITHKGFDDLEEAKSLALRIAEQLTGVIEYAKVAVLEVTEDNVYQVFPDQIKKERMGGWNHVLAGQAQEILAKKILDWKNPDWYSDKELGKLCKVLWDFLGVDRNPNAYRLCGWLETHCDLYPDETLVSVCAEYYDITETILNTNKQLNENLKQQ